MNKNSYEFLRILWHVVLGGWTFAAWRFPHGFHGTLAGFQHLRVVDLASQQGSWYHVQVSSAARHSAAGFIVVLLWRCSSPAQTPVPEGRPPSTQPAITAAAVGTDGMASDGPRLSPCQHHDAFPGCSFRQVKSIEDLSSLPELEDLQIFAFESSADLEALKKLRKLRRLRINCFGGGPTLSELVIGDWISELTELETLKVTCDAELALPGIRGHPRLSRIEFSHARPKDLGQFRDLGKLSHLSIDPRLDQGKVMIHVSDLSPLSKLSNLHTLVLKQAAASDLGPLSGLTNLKVVVVDGAPITALEPLRSLKLEKLSIADTRVSDLSSVAGQTELAVLIIDGTKVRRLEPVANLTKLKKLSLARTRITNLRPVSALTGLETLSIRETKVRNLKPLSKLISLERLDLTKSRVRNLRPLSGLTALEEIRFADFPDQGPPPSRLRPLRHLVNLSIVTCWQESGVSITDYLRGMRPACDK